MLNKYNDIKELLNTPHLYSDLRELVLSYISKKGKSHSVAVSLLGKLKNEELSKHELRSTQGKSKIVYSVEKRHSLYEFAVAIWKNAYFCNFTSIYYHNLTNQIPNTVYIAKEVFREKDKNPNREISDQDIFEAFLKPHRTTKTIFLYNKQRLVFTERVERGMPGVESIKHDKLGILPPQSKITCKERALIDAVLNPQYNGGISSVIEYYRKGAANINFNKFLEIYDRLLLRYPYWQAIGFIFDRIGLHQKAEVIFGRYKAKHKFYLDHGAKSSWPFEKKWLIFYPEGVV